MNKDIEGKHLNKMVLEGCDDDLRSPERRLGGFGWVVTRRQTSFVVHWDTSTKSASQT